MNCSWRQSPPWRPPAARTQRPSLLVAGDEVRLAEDGDTVLAVEALPPANAAGAGKQRGDAPHLRQSRHLAHYLCQRPGAPRRSFRPASPPLSTRASEPWLLHNKCDLASPEAEGLHQELEALGFRVFRLSAQAGRVSRLCMRPSRVGERPSPASLGSGNRPFLTPSSRKPPPRSAACRNG